MESIITVVRDCKYLIFFSSRRRHTRYWRDWSSDVCSSDLFPMAMGTRKIGPAVAAGCTMVAKPAGQTPLSMLALAEILQEAGLPDGVLNVLTRSEERRVGKECRSRWSRYD